MSCESERYINYNTTREHLTGVLKVISAKAIHVVYDKKTRGGFTGEEDPVELIDPILALFEELLEGNKICKTTHELLHTRKITHSVNYFENHVDYVYRIPFKTARARTYKDILVYFHFVLYYREKSKNEFLGYSSVGSE